MIINKLLTTYNKTIANRGVKEIKYIVIHYIGALGDAKANAEYYASKSLSASAHYFVGHNGDVWQGVDDKDIAWHCGGGKQSQEGGSMYKICTNSNSIGIEMCVKKKNTKSLGATDKDWYFESKTVEATVELTKLLMDKYGIPASNVIRHFDVVGKICPNPYVYNNTEHTWNSFKEKLKVSEPKTKTKCRMYKKASTLEGKLHVIPKGSTIKFISDTGNGWSQIEHSGIKGYVKNSCVEKSGLSKFKTATVTKAVHLRSARKTGKATRIKKLPVGKTVKIICTGKSGKWAQVKADGETGFVVTSKIKQ